MISQDVLAALPTSKSVGGMLAFVPGAVSPANGVDTGGTKGEQSVRISVFGARPGDMRQMTNGLLYTNLNGDGGGRLYFVNPVTIQENVIDLGAAGSALYQTSGAVVNTIPREGGNRFSGTLFGAYTNHNLQSSNLSDDLKAQGLTVVNGVRYIGDLNGLVGGPIARTSGGSWSRVGTAAARCARRACSTTPTSTTGSTRPNQSRPVDPDERNRNVQFRTTFQLGKDKFGASTDIQRHYRDQAFGQLDQGTARIEANAAMCHNDSLTQFTWSRPQSNTPALRGRRLGEPQHLRHREFRHRARRLRLRGVRPEPAVPRQHRRRGARRQLSRRGRRSASACRTSSRAVSPLRWCTGAHNFKTGFNLIRGNVTGNTINRADDVAGLPISYTFTNGVPTSMTLFADRNSDAHMDHDMALYAQDQWTLKRLTLNLGLRLDWISAVARRRRSPGQRAVPGLQLAGARAHAELEGPEPAYRRGLRPVRERPHRAQGRDQPLRGRGIDRCRAHCTARRPTSAPPATGPTPTPTSSPTAT